MSPSSVQQLMFRATLSTAKHSFCAFPTLLTQPPLKLCRRCFSYATPIDYPPLHHHPQWSGLHHWRRSPLNDDRYWGPDGPIQNPSEIEKITPPVLSSCSSLAEMGSVVLSIGDPVTKAKLSHLAYTKWRQEGLPIGVTDAPRRPARPPKPRLVSPKEMPSPKNSGLPLNACMLHNLAHVELNAIDLAWDTVVRFSSCVELLGEGFFADFAHVADDESRHFTWCSQRLAELQFSYGDMPAHNFLWRECEKSSDNVAARLAVIPLVQEARGLDAGPRLVNKLIGFGDHRTSRIVAKIADEEVAHVAVGVYWFVLVCQKMGRTPDSTFTDILEEYNVELKGPFNYSAREEAGIPRAWYDPLSTKGEENKLSELSFFHSSSPQRPLEEFLKAAVEAKNYQQIAELFDTSKEYCRNPNPFLFLSTFSESHRAYVVDEILQSFILIRPRSRSHVAYSCLLAYILESQNPLPLAFAIIQRMLRSGCLPVPQTHFLLSKAWVEHRQRSQSVSSILLEMHSIGYSPDCGTCNYLILSLCKVDQIKEALKVLREMGKACLPDLDSYGMLIGEMSELRMTSEVVETVKEMVGTHGLGPRKETILKALEAMRANRDIWRGVDMIQYLEREDVHIEFETYELALEGCLEDHQFVLAGKLAIRMTERGFIPYIQVRQRVVEGLVSVGESELALVVRQRFADL